MQGPELSILRAILVRAGTAGCPHRAREEREGVVLVGLREMAFNAERRVIFRLKLANHCTDVLDHHLYRRDDAAMAKRAGGTKDREVVGHICCADGHVRLWFLEPFLAEIDAVATNDG